MPATVINPNNTGTITIGPTGSEVNVTCQVTNWVLEPSANTAQVNGTFCQPPTTITSQSSWALSFTFLQDWGAPTSLSKMLLDNDGEELDFTFTPANTAVPEATGTITASATSYGGDAGAPWVTTGRMPLTAPPTFTPQL